MSYSIAVIGTGMMGLAVARTLQHAGHQVHAWNRTRAKAEPLAADGIAVHTDVNDAIAAAELIIPVVENCDQAASLLTSDGSSLAGKDVLNLVTGSPRDVETLVTRLEQAGARVGSGTIMCFPAEIGHTDSTILFGGSEAFWERYNAVITSLGGGSIMIGAESSLPNKIDTALVGCMVTNIHGCFLEAVKYLRKEGVDPRLFAQFLPNTMAVLQALMQHSLDQIDSGDFSTDQASLNTFKRSQGIFRRAMAESGTSDFMLEASEKWIGAAMDAGDSDLSLTALVRH